MALNTADARKYSPQVLTAVDTETVKIKDGEYGTPDVMNRALMASINGDAALEAALTYMGRSSSLFTTDTTRFLSHCEGEGLDVISAKSPTLTTDAATVFIADQNFLGAAWPSKAVTNLLSNVSGASTSLTVAADTYWTIANPDGVQATISYGADGATVDNHTYASTITPGFVTFTTPKTPLTGTGAATQNKISVGYTAICKYNMVKYGLSAGLVMEFYDTNNTVIDSTEVKVVKGELNAWVAIEDYTIPTNATSFSLQIKLGFNNTDSKGIITVQRLMAMAGSALLPWTETTREQSTAVYEDVVDFANGDITASCWAIFKPYSLVTHTGPIGPLFLSNDYVSFGGVHQSSDGANLVLALRMKQKDQDPVYGPKVTIPNDYINTYLWSALRIRQDEADTTKAVVEYVIIAGYNIYVSSLTVNKGLIDTFDLSIGYGRPFTSTSLDGTEYFNGPITEVRYDTEWLNDTEAYVISLSKKPFSFKKSNDLGAAESVETVVDVLDRTGVNLIVNPTGRLGLLSWNWEGATPAGFATVHNDAETGNCFEYIGSTATTVGYTLASDYITIQPTTTYTLRAMMSFATGSTGSIGIGIAWYDSSFIRIDSVSRVDCVADSSTKYYKMTATSSGTAKYAKVLLLLGTGLKTTKALWSRLKLEAGDATQFSDDSGAGYAVYY